MINKTLISLMISSVMFTWSMGVSAQALHVAPNGNVGIGTLSPSEAVDVVRSSAAARFKLTAFTGVANEAPQYVQQRARGTSGAPTAVASGDNLGLFSFRGHTGSGFSGSKAFIATQTTEAWTPTANGTRMLFGTTENGTTGVSTVMEITHDGKVKINGTTLSVPDYVFESDYNLMSLDELSDYIKENKHLPGVASADDVHNDGLDIAGSQLSVLEKVEELTLYTLQQHEALKQLEVLKTENMVLKAAYHALQEKVEKVDQLEQVVNLLVQRQANDELLTFINP